MTLIVTVIESIHLAKCPLGLNCLEFNHRIIGALCEQKVMGEITIKKPKFMYTWTEIGEKNPQRGIKKLAYMWFLPCSILSHAITFYPTNSNQFLKIHLSISQSVFLFGFRIRQVERPSHKVSKRAAKFLFFKKNNNKKPQKMP